MLSPDENEQIDIADLPGVKAVATGVLGEGSCFFHSVILGLSPSEYLGLPRTDRTEYAGKLRGIIADGITVDYWLGLESTQIYLAENIRVILTSLSTNKTYKKKSSIIDAINQRLLVHQIKLSEKEIMVFDVSKIVGKKDVGVSWMKK